MNATVLRRPSTRANLRWLGLSLAVIVVDQATKHWVLAVFRPGEDVPLTSCAGRGRAVHSAAAGNVRAGGDGGQRWLRL